MAPASAVSTLWLRMAPLGLTRCLRLAMVRCGLLAAGSRVGLSGEPGAPAAGLDGLPGELGRSS